MANEINSEAMTEFSQIAGSSSKGSTVWTGIGEKDLVIAWQGWGSIPATFPKLQSVPLDFAYNFPGVLGTSDFDAKPIGGQKALQQAVFQKWSDAIRQSEGIVKGDVLNSYVIDYARKTIADKGLFNNLVPGALNGIVVQGSLTYDKDHNIGAKDVNLPNEYRDQLNPVIDAYNNLISRPTGMNNYQIDLANNNQDNVLLMGPYSKTDITIGNGNNIVINSPAMFAGVTLWFQPTGTTNYWPKKVSNDIFYPSVQGEKSSNTLTLGNGNNIVYYDSSFRTIKTGDGDNIFLPSFGSFNWANNNLQLLGVTNGNYVTKASNATWFTPVTQSSGLDGTPNNKLYGRDNTYAVVSNWPDGDSTKAADIVTMTYVGGTAGAPNNPKLANNMIDPAKLNAIGGQEIIGGNGSDVFYGVDPSFYSFNSATGTGIDGEENRTVFRLQTADSKNERFSYQAFETITMLGAGGNDIFYLGNPTKLGADGLNYKGTFSYEIATSHKAMAAEIDKSDLKFGNIEYGVNTIVVNLATNVNSYTNTMKSFDQESGKDKSTIDFYQQGKAAAQYLEGYFKPFDKLVGSAIIPYADIFWSAVSGIETLVKIFTPPDPKPIEVSDQTLSQPLGTWRHAIKISDWNPGTIIKIEVDPTITLPNGAGRWDNIRFTKEASNVTSDSRIGSTISWEEGSTKKGDLFRIDGMGNELFGYYSFDFTTGKYVQINQNHLNFFGTIAIGVDGISPLKNYKSENGFQFSSTDPSVAAMTHDGAYQFYWNDAKRIIGDAHEASRDITIQFDSRSLGWFWQPVLKSSLPAGQKSVSEESFSNSLSLDYTASKLWIRDDAKWISFSFFEIGNITEAYQASLQAQTFYQVNGRRGSKVSDNQKFTMDLANDLENLIPIMPDLKLLKQDSNATIQLTSLAQITAIEKKGSTAVDVYFKQTVDTLDVYKMTISKGAGSSAAGSDPVLVKKSDVQQLETDLNQDIDANSVIGATAVDLLKKGADVSTEQLLKGLYQTVLERAPDDGGLKAWSDAINSKGISVASLLDGFFSSAEFHDLQASNKEFISALYAHLLLRIEDQQGASQWLAALEKGATYTDVALAFLQSSEFAAVIGSHSTGLTTGLG